MLQVGDSIATPASAAELDGLPQQMAVEARNSGPDAMQDSSGSFLPPGHQVRGVQALPPEQGADAP